MTTSSWTRPRHVATAATVLTLIAVLTGAVIVTVGAGVPEAWWPRTGQAFTTTHSARPEPCAPITGPAKKYCERGTAATGGGQRDVAGAVFRLGTAGAGAAALVVWRVRHAAARRRR